jgi:hypothetical protein
MPNLMKILMLEGFLLKNASIIIKKFFKIRTRRQRTFEVVIFLDVPSGRKKLFGISIIWDSFGFSIWKKKIIWDLN